MIKPDPEPRRLPGHLAKKLPPNLCDALEHPLRRRILRTLHTNAQRLSLSDLAAAGPAPCSLSRVGYHVRVLNGSGLVKEAGSEPAGGSTKRYFSSSVGDKQAVLAVLEDTEELDNGLSARSSAR